MRLWARSVTRSVDHGAGSRAFSSSTQVTTTTMLARFGVWPPSFSLIIFTE